MRDVFSLMRANRGKAALRLHRDRLAARQGRVSASDGERPASPAKIKGRAARPCNTSRKTVLARSPVSITRTSL